MHIVNTGIYRPNLNYNVMHNTSVEEKLKKLQNLIQKSEGSGIIYTATVKAVEDLAEALQAVDGGVTLYHGRLPGKVRSENQERFMGGKSRVMVATNAFGMGIDKPDIRFVVHFQIPGTLEAYYQESGRAGRDGKVALCTLLYNAQDKRIQQFFLAHHHAPGYEDLHEVYKRLQELLAEQSVAEFQQLQEKIDGFSVARLQVILRLFEDEGIVAQDKHMDYGLQKKNIKREELIQLAETTRSAVDHERQALERMVFYAQSGFCRWKILLEYFNEEAAWDHCGHCDNCVNPPSKAPATPTPDPHPNPDAENFVLLSSFPVGATVEVSKVGKGQIVSSSDDMVTILFPDSQKRTFLRSYVKLIHQIPEGTAP